MAQQGTTSQANESPAKPIVQFQVGAVLAVATADGVLDKDVRGADKNVTESLQWYSSTSKTGMGTAIENETDPTYTVTTTDVGKYIRVVAYYTVDRNVNQESASLISDYPVLLSRTTNKAPEFDPDTVKRSVSEGKKGMNVGAPVTATDDISNALTYALMTGGDDDDGKFKIDPKTGQITTRFDLNREATTPATASDAGSCAADSGNGMQECVVTVTATDSAGAPTAPAATVTIKITNVDEKPKFDTGYKMKSIEEGKTEIDDDEDSSNDAAGEAIYAATDTDGLRVNLSLMGVDGAKFELSTNGVLSFKAKPDYEMPTDRNKDNVYEVTVRASDGTLYADRMVKVTVTDDDEAPEIIAGGLAISGQSSVSYAEDGTDRVVATYTLAGPDSDSVRRMTLTGDDAGDFRISSGGVLTFARTPDFETPADADENNVYMVTLNATDSEDNTAKRAVVVTVTEVVEDVPVIGGTLLERYDTLIPNGQIDLSEILKAAVDYFDEKLTIGQILDLAVLYFNNN